jgi:transcriptional regulator with XRE-family HTH domain
MRTDTYQELKQLRKQIGMNIRYVRTTKEFTLRKLALRTQINANVLDQLELGKNTISFDLLYKIALALEVDMNRLLRPTLH